MSSKSVTLGGRFGHGQTTSLSSVFFLQLLGGFIIGARGCTFHPTGHFSGILHHNCGMTGERLGSTSRLELHIKSRVCQSLNNRLSTQNSQGWYCSASHPLWLFRRIVMVKPVRHCRVLISCKDYEMVLGVIALWGVRDGRRAFMDSLCTWSTHTTHFFALVDEYIFFKHFLCSNTLWNTDAHQTHRSESV